MRLGIRALLGFDFVHAWRNRRGIGRAEVVWTHTESQYLAVLLLFQARRRTRRPKLIAQSVWLFDRWDRLSRPWRWFYAWLMRQADVLTVHSPDNLQRARELFPMCRSEIVPFGIRTEPIRSREPRKPHCPIRVLSLGNDRHRDWMTLVDAIKGWERCELRLVSRQIPRALVRGARNVEVVCPSTNDELMALYEWADIVALALKPNLHASGITVVEEATVCGVPVICTDTGGLRAYFSDGEVTYVPPRQPEALRWQIASFAQDDDAGAAMVKRARERMVAAGLSSRDFARRHARLSRELLDDPDLGRTAPSIGEHNSTALSPQSSLRSVRGATFALCLLAGIAALVEIGPVPNQARGEGAAIDLCAFVPTFSEEFDTLSVSPWGENGSRWIAHTPWHGDFGDAAFADPRPGFPFRVRAGILEIEARKDADGKWQSGLLASVSFD